MAVASRDTGPADKRRRDEWLELAARAVRADRAARAERAERAGTAERKGTDLGSSRFSGRTVLMEHAIGARNLARVEANARARPAVRAATRPAARTAVRPEMRTAVRPAPAGRVALLVIGSLYGLAMAAVTAVAVARYATTDPLGAVGPVAFIGVAAGFLALAGLILSPALRSRSSRRD